MKRLLMSWCMIAVLVFQCASIMPGCSIASAETHGVLSSDTPAIFLNAGLEAWVREQLNKTNGEALTVGDLDAITSICYGGNRFWDEITSVIYRAWATTEGCFINGEQLAYAKGFTFDDLSDLSMFRNLRVLKLIAQQVSDLSPLKDLPLEELDLTNNYVVDLSPLHDIETLTRLTLANSAVSDLSPLAGLSGLQYLDISHTNVTDLSTLMNLPSLDGLVASYSAITNFTPLTTLRSLKWIEAAGCGLTDLSAFIGLDQLDSLSLHHSAISDITDLPSLKKLTFLGLDDCTAFDPAPLLESPSIRTLAVSHEVGSDVAETCEKIGIELQVNEFGPYRFAPGENLLPLVAVPPVVSKAQRLPEHYVPIDSTGGYNTETIPDSLLGEESTLPDAAYNSLPAWKGLTNEVKYLFGGRYQYIYENDIKNVADWGLNCVRVIYSFSYLSDPADPWQVDQSELERLDELVSWCIKYNVHLMLSGGGMPGTYDSIDEEYDRSKLYNNPDMAKLATAYWRLLATRYAGIPSRYLSFELYSEPNYAPSDIFNEVFGAMIDAVQDEDAERLVIIQNNSNDIPGALLKKHVALSVHSHLHTYEMDDTWIIGLDGYSRTQPIVYLPGHLEPGKGTDTVRFTRDGDFIEGMFRIRIQGGRGTVLFDKKKAIDINLSSADAEWFEATIPDGTKAITVKTNSDILDILAVEIVQEAAVTKLANTTQFTGPAGRKWPNSDIVLATDGSAVNADGSVINEEWVYKNIYEPWLKAVKKYKVGVCFTEVAGRMDSRPNAEVPYYINLMITPLIANDLGFMTGDPDLWNDQVMRDAMSLK